MPLFKSEDEAVRQHMYYGYDTDQEGKYVVGGHALHLYRVVKDAIPENSMILDIGCNSGAIGRLLMRDKNVVCFGVDVSPVMILRAATKGIFAHCGKAEHLHWTDGYFDAVVLLEILEHVYDDKVVLNEATRVLTSGGILIGSVPYPKGQAGSKGFHRHAYHARVYDKRSLKKLLKTKLKSIEIKNILTDPDITGIPNWMFFKGVKK